MALWVVALVAGAAPRRVWPRLEPPLPLFATAFPAGVLTLTIGFAIGVPGFFAFSQQLAVANNDWMFRQLLGPSEIPTMTVVTVPYGVSVVTLFIFLFLTPIGLLSLYLAASGTVRAIAAYLDPEDARGDFVLSGIHWAASSLWAKGRREGERLARERREGPEAPDRLFTGDWAGVDADYVLVASRRKAEWEAGAIILTSTEWYRLGVPFDLETPSGLRTIYPLTKLESAEVLRRGIRYELPKLSRHATQKPQNTRS